jgi:hypothetical protein
MAPGLWTLMLKLLDSERLPIAHHRAYAHNYRPSQYSVEQ